MNTICECKHKKVEHDYPCVGYVATCGIKGCPCTSFRPQKSIEEIITDPETILKAAHESNRVQKAEICAPMKTEIDAFIDSLPSYVNETPRKVLKEFILKREAEAKQKGEEIAWADAREHYEGGQKELWEAAAYEKGKENGYAEN